MLRRLRIRLSLLYLVASIGLVAILAGSTYGLLALYFRNSTDLALEYKMAQEFHTRGLSLPPALAAAEQNWLAGNTTRDPVTAPSGDGDEDDGHDVETLSTDDERYDGNLATVFVVDSTQIVSVGMPVVSNAAAVSSALQNGSDLRTVPLDDGSRLRLLTYRLGDSGMVIQMGRLLTDQDRLLSKYLIGLIVLGGAASLLLALAGWGLAGRSIAPAQHAMDQQQQFVSNASHELRTPLTILRANADYALRSSSVKERELALHDIVDQCDYMNDMVEDLLLLSRLDAHRLTLKLEAVPLADLFTEAAHQVEKLAVAGGVTVSVDPASGTLRGDRSRLRQVLLILLDNALRFTPSGGTIRLSARTHGKEVHLTVSDNGAGIPPADLPHLFERFYQVAGQESEKRGNGLGLSIAKALVEVQHGHISISSEPGQGTQVKLVFPSA